MSRAIPLLVIASIPAARAADYDGDHIDDLVVGVPYEDVGRVANPGAIEIIRGSSTGLTSAGDGFIHQDTTGVAGSASELDIFGSALAAGDIDGDHETDLVVGGPGNVTGTKSCGAIWRLGLTPTRSGLGVTDSQSFSQDTRGITDSCEDGDDFGFAIVVADFDGDRYDDVVVGVPGEDVGLIIDAGAVHYLRGGSSGLTTSGALYYHQDVMDAAGSSEEDELFGLALAAGDFDADGYADLAIGVPGEDWDGVDEGTVQVMYGSSAGPSVTRPNDERWSPGESSVAGTVTDYSKCGTALSVGDFDGDGYDDLAIGCPWDETDGAEQAGSVLVVYGSSAGLDSSEVWSQGSASVADDPEEGDGFGGALTSGDYDGDGYDDLAIGVPVEDVASFLGAGIVQVLRGSSAGLTDLDNVLLAQDGFDVYGYPSDFDYWGSVLASGDYNDDGLDDLAVGNPGDPADNDTLTDEAGVVNVFYGSGAGVSTTGNVLFHQDVTGIEDTSEALDWFGAALR